jgi:DNA-binding MarR family transcriptional regulator
MHSHYTGTTADRVLQHLQAYKLKQERNNYYRCHSPLRAGSDSHSFTLTLDDGEHGAYFDHVTSEKGSLYDLAKALGIPVPITTQIESTKRQYFGIDDYAKAHGIDAETLMSYGWRETDHKGRKALEFQTRTGLRWRFLDGEKPHYISSHGYARSWYGLSDRIVARLADDKNPILIICNGEISVVSAQSYGLNAIAVTGGEKEIPPNLIAELKGKVGNIQTLMILVAMDCDSTGVKASHAITNQLNEAGFIVRAVDLGLGLGGDLSDFCMLHQTDLVLKLLELKDIQPNEHTNERQYQFFSLDQVLALPPVQWLIRGVLPKQGLSMVYGPSGVGKSFYALGMAYDLAFEHNVVYIAAEGETGMGVRAQALIKHKGEKPDKLTFVLGAIDLFDDEELIVFKRLSSQYNPALIVVDTLAMCTGVADENSARDMKRIIDGSKRMAKELKCAVLLVHHTNKEGREARGSGALFNACDTVIRLTRSDDVLVVESQKTKDLKSFEPIMLKEVSIELGKDSEGETITSLVLEPAEKVIDSECLTPLQKIILEAIAVDPRVSIRDLAFTAEVKTPTTIYRALKKLETIGLVGAFEDGERQLTDKGKDVVYSVHTEKPQVEGSVHTVHTVPSNFCKNTNRKTSKATETGGTVCTSPETGGTPETTSMFPSGDNHYKLG